MKKVFKYAMLFATALVMSATFTSCSDDDDDPVVEPNQMTEKEQAMKDLTAQYVNNVIFPIYTSLANQSDDLFNKLVEAKAKLRAGTLAQSDIDAICNVFLSARSAWEQSEAFLYGAATDWGIDPHIDTWPLDRTALAVALSNKEAIAVLDDIEGGAIENARVQVGEQQLGFHGIEFILFREGKNRTVEALMGTETDNAFAGRNITGEEELVFAAAVAGDLRDKCFQLEVSWLGEKAAKAHRDRVEECEFNTTVGGGEYYYGENIINATQAGSTYASWRGVMNTILVAGCSNICAEVSGQKIGQAYTGEDTNYIESPYSQRSYYDFFDNITSVQYALNGQMSAQPHANSIMAYLQKYNPDMAADLQEDLNKALQVLTTAKAGTPFVLDYHSANAKAAMDAINELDEELNEAAEWIAAN